MKNWKTTAAAGVSAAASFVLFAGGLHYIGWPPWVMAVALFAQSGGLAAFGISARDA